MAFGKANITQVYADQVVIPPREARRAAPWALPDAPAMLVGRGEQEAKLARLLAPCSEARIIVVAGLAGVGKSALALTVAQRALAEGRFAGGVLFVELLSYSTADVETAVGVEQALVELLAQLGVSDRERPTSHAGRLARYRSELAERERAGKRVLVVVDDAAEVRQVRDLIPPGGDAHRMLVTSRNRLLDHTFPARILTLGELAPAPAEALIATQLRASLGSDRAAAEPTALVEIAQHCDGLPLALTIAAAVLVLDPGLPLRELAGQLAEARHRLERLSPPDGSGLPTGVLAAFDVSYARLPAAQARIFRLLSRHPGIHCTTAVAVALAHTRSDEMPEWSAETLAAVRNLLVGLANTGLLTEQPLGSGRWRMHSLVRLYATQRAEELDTERVAATGRMLAALIHLAGLAKARLDAQPGQPGPEPFTDSSSAADWFEAEAHALMWAARTADQAGLPNEVQLLARHLGLYFLQRGRFDALDTLYRLALDVARRAGDWQAEATALHRLATLSSSTEQHADVEQAHRDLAARLHIGPDTTATAREQGSWADQMWRSGRAEEAEIALNEALQTCRREDDPRTEFDLLDVYATLLIAQSRHDEAIEMRELAVGAARSLSGYWLAHAWEELADTLSLAGRGEAAVVVYERALALFREEGPVRRVATALSGLADALWALGRHEEALRTYRDCMAAHREAHEPYPEGITAVQMGSLLTKQDRPKEALPLLRRACDLLGDVEDQRLLATAWEELCKALSMCEQHKDAEAALLAADEIYAELGDEARRAKLAHVLRLLQAASGSESVRPGLWVRLRRWSRRS
ncbi:tetratricopeptide repeat protein [Streptomyces sp. NPDC016566]|uniref:tetratricopeptide repeat protein n=1 Tax=Streptomyces sp. NPDC016566 TaxID=3364967 RepID=UPI0036FA9ADA